MQTNTQEAVLSAYIASIGKRTPRHLTKPATRKIMSLTHLAF